MSEKSEKCLAEWDAEIVAKGTYYSITISKKLIDNNVIQLGQPIHVRIWQEGRV